MTQAEAGPRLSYALDTLPEVLRSQARARPDSPALVAGSADGSVQRPTFSELDAASDRFAAGLRSQGLELGDRVALLARNTVAYEAVVAYHGIHKAGMVTVPLNARFVGPELAELLGHCGARMLIGEDELLRPVASHIEAVEDLDSVVAIGPEAKAPHTTRWLELADSAGNVDDLPVVGPSDHADWLFTSGTTGRPKCVMTTHAGCVATGVIMRGTFGLVAGDVLQTPFPFYTSSGCHSSLLSALVAGATYVIDPEVDVPAMLERIEGERTTVFGAVPAILTYFLESEALAGTTLDAVRILFSGGSAIPASLVDRILGAFANAALVNAYGLTEAGNAGLALSSVYARSKPGALGREAMPGTEYEVVDPDGRALGRGEVGELVLRGPSMMAGYYDDPEATSAALRDGWLHTGDLVRIDDEDFVFLHDRMKDIIIRGGFNISSLEVEQVLVAHSDVSEAAVVAKPHPRLGEDLCAFVVAVPGQAVDPDSVRAHCAERLADFKVPRDLVVLEELPKNATGKVLKARLRECTLAGTSKQPSGL